MEETVLYNIEKYTCNMLDKDGQWKNAIISTVSGCQQVSAPKSVYHSTQSHPKIDHCKRRSDENAAATDAGKYHESVNVKVRVTTLVACLSVSDSALQI